MLMAKFLQTIGSPALIIVAAATVLIFVSVLAPVSAAGGSIVGARTELPNVQANEEVQELGRFCVEEYNRRLQESGRVGAVSGGVLVFSEVVEAQTQVVSGIKYYLRIAATEVGVKKMFDAVVVEKPWVKSNSKELLDFAPSSN
ncbi:cysteine proteinase inhibitor 5-like [Malania oleifera]|uniref:cysteine proteinase inhibitor 5-like n=1 Tax=Malania oleifera TaxID=397392 RepID=UPI0025AE9B42|nr:cysteine proteinase inhibitor 5-like [Malania oleifera]